MRCLLKAAAAATALLSLLASTVSPSWLETDAGDSAQGSEKSEGPFYATHKVSSLFRKGDSCQSTLKPPHTERLNQNQQNSWGPVPTGGPYEGPHWGPPEGPKLSIGKGGGPRGDKQGGPRGGPPIGGPQVSLGKDEGPSEGAPTIFLEEGWSPRRGPLRGPFGRHGGPLSRLDQLRGRASGVSADSGFGGVSMLQEGIGDSRERGSGVSADLSPAAREELLRALHTSSSSVVAATYSVHIQTKERRQLAAFLQGKTKTIDEEEEERPVSMVQQSVTANGGNIESYTSSGAQVYLDEKCILKGKTEGKMYIGARFTVQPSSAFCFLQEEIDFTTRSIACVDSCLNKLSCNGAIKKDILKKVNADSVFASERRLTFDPHHVRVEFCYTSRVQSYLDGLCDEKEVARQIQGMWRCVSFPFGIDFSGESPACVDDCGETVSCYFSPAFIISRTITDGYKVQKQLSSVFCPCDERMLNGVYKGCQTQTRLGRTCQRWNSQSPHKHIIQLGEDASNYCRNPGNEQYIWCFTTDPSLRFDICDPIGVSRQYVQPASKFSIEYHEVGASPYKALRLFEGGTETTACGAPGLSLAMRVSLPVNEYGVIIEMPEVVVEEGQTQKLIWKDIELRDTQFGSLLACICDFQYIANSSYREIGTCTKTEDFNIHGGMLTIMGPVPYTRHQLPFFGTSTSFELPVVGVNLKKGDRLDIARVNGETSCLLRSLEKTLSVARGFAAAAGVSSASAAAWLQQAFRIETSVAIKTVQQGRLPYGMAVSEEISLFKVGRYIVCWTGEGTDGKATGVVTLFQTTGFDASTKQVATYAPSSAGANETLFSVFVLHGGRNVNLNSISFTLREATESPCQGDTLAQSSQVSSFQEDDEREVVRGSGFLLRPGSSGQLQTRTALHICLETGSRSLFTGFAMVAEFSLYQPWQVNKKGRQLGVPLGVHAVTLSPFSPLGLHWLHNDTSGLINGDKESVFTKGQFSKTLTFEVYEQETVVNLWTHDDTAPVLLLTLQRSGWLSLSTDITFERFFLYAAETGEQAAVRKYDARDPGSLLIAAADAVSSEPLHAPCCLLTVYEDTATQTNPSILLLDSKGGNFVWLDGLELSLVQSKNNWQGLKSPLQYPTSLACLPREKEESVSSSGDAAQETEETEAKEEQQGDTSNGNDFWGLYDCYIADRDGDRIVHIEVDAAAKQSALVSEIAYAGPKATRLTRPLDLVAFKYNGETLLFVLQEGKVGIDLLVPTSGGATDYHGSSQDTAGLNLGAPTSAFSVEVGERGSGLDFARLVVYRTSLEDIFVQSVSLDATAVAPAFTYTHAGWYTVGDEVLLEPLIAGRTSMSAFNSFYLNPNVANFAFVRQIASVDRIKGTLSLQLAPSTGPSVEVGVVGQGVVNEVNSSISFYIACKNGHFMRHGMCAKCPVGTYNSLALVKQSPLDRWGACKPCEENKSTVSEGSTSEDQCICAKGFHLDEQAPEKGCVPCPPGTWKDTVSNTGCLGTRCPANSSSTVSGATTAEERKCACNPGYVYDKDLDSCILAAAGTFSPGGYRASAFACPLNTTTVSDSTGPFTSLQDCACNKGFEPASAESLNDSNSSAYKFREWLRSIPEYAGIGDHQVCVPCGYKRYKETVSSSACVPCPMNSYSSTHSPTSKKDCNMCLPGFYETENEEFLCGQCPPGYICVGSEPAIPSLVAYAGIKKVCLEHSNTLPGTVENDHPYKCLCLPGYEAVFPSWGLGMITCRAVEKGTFKDMLSNTPAQNCPFGAKSETVGADSLSLCVCGAGEYRDTATNRCMTCPKGFYCPGGYDKEEKVEKTKVRCPSNMTTAEEGAKSASECMCGAGYYLPVSNAAEEYKNCLECPINTYKDTIGNTFCRSCNDNSGTTTTGATSASQCLCNGGYYYSDELKQCTACRDPRKYCPGGSVACTDEPSCVGGSMPAPPVPCPSHTRITAGFDTPSSPNDCLCDKGFAFRGYDEMGGKKCAACAAGSYKTSVQDANCNGLCGSHSTSLQGMQDQSQCFCEAGTYFAAGSCHECPAGATCLGGLSEDARENLLKDPTTVSISSKDHIKPYPKAGFFLVQLREELEDPGDWYFIKCPVSSACQEHGRCIETMADFLCSECKPGFTNTFDHEEICTQCPSTGANITLCILYYLCLLLFNIAMAYMNVAAGFNRRSIHSIVIKIASNFVTCMWVLSVVDLEQIELPSWLYRLQSDVAQQISSSQKTHWTSVDCVLREALALSYGDSFFFTRLFYAFLPIFLPLAATLIMFIFVSRVKHYYRHSTQRKLGVLQQTIRFDLVGLTEQLRDKLEEDRLFMMFRYVPLPGESAWRRAYKFFEDMTPIYVTVSFFIYTSTTRYMLSLLECKAIDFGEEHGRRYFLTSAMSVECVLSPSSDYFKFFVLGLAGLLLWSIGIPLGAFLVLYVNRKNLNSKETRLKYGFLHNGFVREYWYWETVVFARKLSVLVVSSILLFGTSTLSAASITVATAIAIAFNILHLRCQPFDKRSYSTLDRLENHSMAIWTIASCTMGLLLGARFSGLINAVLLGFIGVPVIFFVFEVGVNLVFAYFDNVRATRSFFWVPFIGQVFRFFSRLSEKRRAREPVVIFNDTEQSIQLVAAKRTGRFARLFRQREKSINYEERIYFLKVMGEALGLAVVHLRLDVIPGSFIEFALRLGLAFSRLEEENQNKKASLQALAGGDMSKLLDWTLQQEATQEKKRQLLRTKSSMAVGMHSYYTDLQKKLEEQEETLTPPSDDEEEEETKKDRLRDIEGGESSISESSSEAAEEDKKDLDMRLQELEKFVSRMTEEEQEETTYLFNEDLTNCGIALSELYLSLLKLQLKSPSAIADQFEAFREKKEIVLRERAEKYKIRNNKLRIIRDALLCLLQETPGALSRVLPTQEETEKVQQKLEQIKQQNQELLRQLEELRENPDSYDKPGDKDNPLEWIEAKEAEDGDNKTQQQTSTPTTQQEQQTSKPQDNASVSSQASKLSDLEAFSIEGEEESLQGAPYRVVGANAADWLED